MTGYFDMAVVGGGLVGSAIAYGLTGHGLRTVVLDGPDSDHRASRGNFGLIWVQGKGVGSPPYAEWTRRSALLWEDLAPELGELTGIDVQYSRTGGLHLCPGNEEYRSRRALLTRLAAETGGRFAYRMLSREETAEKFPAVGPDIAGSSWCPLDGHVNPLGLLRALQAGVVRRGGLYRPGAAVRRIRRVGTAFRMERAGESLTAGRVVIAAGLATGALARQVGLHAPVHPVRGQILVTERVSPLLDLPTAWLRQTGEGTLLIGDSHEDVGFDDGTRTEVLAALADRAVRAVPRLAGVRVIRAWGALRVMTPDGLPIYAASSGCPGAYVACCHSGVTLAAVHATRLAGWVAEGILPDEIRDFAAERFDVHTA